MAGRRCALEAGNLAAHAHIAVGVLDRALERRRQLGDGPFHNVIEGGLCHTGRISCGGEAPCYTKCRPHPKGLPARHEHPHPRFRRTRARAGLEDRGEPAHRQALLRAGQCRHRAGGRMRRARSRRPQGGDRLCQGQEDRSRRGRAGSAALRRHRRRSGSRRHQGLRPDQMGGAAGRLQGLHQGPVQGQQYPDRGL